jgi:MFS family permease
MYTVVNPSALLRASRTRGSRVAGLRVPRTVVLLGACSLLTDISSEMVATVLPLYLVTTLGFSPLQFGVVDGVYQGAGAFVRLGAGHLGDRLRRHKPVAAVGYGLSAVAKLALATVGQAFGALSAVVVLDRVGKGIRTAPRDAMISLASDEKELGTSFGVHRAMDSAGAMIGPLVAFGLLAAAPSAFRTLFLVSFFIALLGLGVIGLLVDEPRGASAAEAPERADLRGALGLLARRPFRALTVVACALGLATISDAFVYLILLDRVAFDASLFPLLATGTAAAYMLLAIPAGRIADRVGRGRVLLAGYALLLATYLVLLTPSLSAAGVIVAVILLGGYYAATDGVLAAMGSAHLGEHLRGSGLALLGTATSGARLIASVIFGAVWTWLGIDAAVCGFGVALLLAIGVAGWGLRAAHV